MAITMAGRDDRDELENGDKLALKFDDRGLIPVVTTCADTGKLLMQAWASVEAVELTLKTGEAHYFSRSRETLWHKGATSGEIQYMTEIRTDCDQDCLHYIVKQSGGGCCHTGRASCFYRIIPLGDDGGADGDGWKLVMAE